MILATFSGLHGHNDVPRGWCMGLSAAIYGLIFWLFFSWWGLLVMPVVLAWWVFLRGSRTENAENAYMDTESDHVRPSLHDVLKAHYYTGWLSILSLRFFNYSTRWGQKLGWEGKAAKEGRWHGKPVRVDEAGRVEPDDRPYWDCRRPTELAGGLTLDIALWALILWEML